MPLHELGNSLQIRIDVEIHFFRLLSRLFGLGTRNTDQATRFLYDPRLAGFGSAASTSAAMSATSQSRLVTPAAIAGWVLTGVSIRDLSIILRGKVNHAFGALVDVSRELS
jgi:hypothetical protein